MPNDDTQAGEAGGDREEKDLMGGRGDDLRLGLPSDSKSPADPKGGETKVAGHNFAISKEKYKYSVLFLKYKDIRPLFLAGWGRCRPRRLHRLRLLRTEVSKQKKKSKIFTWHDVGKSPSTAIIFVLETGIRTVVKSPLPRAARVLT